MFSSDRLCGSSWRVNQRTTLLECWIGVFFRRWWFRRCGCSKRKKQTPFLMRVRRYHSWIVWNQLCEVPWTGIVRADFTGMRSNEDPGSHWRGCSNSLPLLYFPYLAGLDLIRPTLDEVDPIRHHVYEVQTWDLKYGLANSWHHRRHSRSS